MSYKCPECGYKINKGRCFNCDYAERGSDGPWNGKSDQALIMDAELIWNRSDPFFTNDFKYHYIYEYLKQRQIFELATTCDQLRASTSLHRIVHVKSGSCLVGRIWHVRLGFIGVHVTQIEYVGGDKPFARDQRRTVGACQGGAVWFGSVSPTTELVVGEGIETVLSAMILWKVSAGAATLGTSGLRCLVLPQAARRIVIAADNDAPVYKGLKKLPNGMDAARARRRMWLQEDPTRDVEIRLAPPPLPGTDKRDWNYVLMEACHG